jgi:hypothetical protein
MATPNYHSEALCGEGYDPDLWAYMSSIERDKKRSMVYNIIAAKKICDMCPVKMECLKEGLQEENLKTHQGEGLIWGGMLVSERALMLRLSPYSRIIREENILRREVQKQSAKIGQ